MTITYSVDHMQTSVEDVSIEVSEKSAMTHQRTTRDEKSGENATVYVLASGDASLPATVTYRSAINTRGKDSVRRMSCTLASWATSVDSVSGEEKHLPIQATISFIIPTEMQVELTDLDDVLGNVFSYMYPSVSAKARSTAFLSKLLFGVTQVA